MATIDKELVQLEAQLQQWMELLESLAARVRGSDPDGGSERGRHIDALRGKHREARATLADVKSDRREKRANSVHGAWSAVEARFFRNQ